MLTSITFKRQWQAYNAGEVAGFTPEQLAKIPVDVYDRTAPAEPPAPAPAPEDAPPSTPVTPSP